MTEYTYETREPRNGLTEVHVLHKSKAVGVIKLLEGRMEGVLDIPYLKVDKAHRGKGLATELHSRALAIAAKKGLRLRTVNKLKPELEALWSKLKLNRRAAEGGDIKTGAASEG
jgi:GNAT superfamily N-acetyltransferase